MRLSAIIPSYDYLLPDPYLPQAEIVRLKGPDLHPEIIQFNLGALLAGTEDQNLQLHDLDRVRIYHTWEKREKNYDIDDIVEIKHNIPFIGSHEISETSFSIPKDNYFIRLEKLEKTDEIIKRKRVKTRFFSSLDDAWKGSLTKLKNFIEITDEKLYKFA